MSWVFPATLAVLWLLAALVGLGFLLQYEKSPGIAANLPSQWPSNTRIVPSVTQPTLLMILHPHCPCSRASLGELAKLMAHCQGQVKAFAIFYKPQGVEENWEKTDLWQSASRIPGVELICDNEGRVADLFHAKTSGQAILYHASGTLLWSGGITGGRGHAGDNQGGNELLAAIRKGAPNVNALPVFGCSLRSPDSRNRSSSLCCQK